jgi:hypothetical protein
LASGGRLTGKTWFFDFIVCATDTCSCCQTFLVLFWLIKNTHYFICRVCT